MASESTTFALIETGVYLLILAALLVMLKCLIGVARRRMLPRPKYVAIDRAFTDYDKHQNWSWDWCLVFPVREARERAPAPESLAQRRLEQYSLRFVVERLETGAGLETTLFRSHDRSAVFCKVRERRTPARGGGAHELHARAQPARGAAARRGRRA
eukprot:CAMPEP_0119295172 /NCGR_PEP_ID=MMETSP1329-20130426/49347_1 /TAXON_ID=114041 /ORGANISM="Genus nov. species nov., Strain RCC1024" /LENGTH=156 /DNA_ID=CAMNT_0007296083 /DNA_START=157 /DNA_END=624 /DNA_ORIENTATION=+